jgi:hypothetical protein
MAELIATLPAVLARGIHDRLSAQARAVKAARSQAVDGDVGAGASAHGADDTVGEWARGLDTQVATAEAAATRVEPAGRGEPAAPDETSAVVEAADDRSMDELRADILCDLLLTATPTLDDPSTALGAIRASVQVTVPVLTLAGRPGGSATLAGSGPIDAETARILCGNAAGWDRVMTHPISGAVLAVDRYRPSEELKRALRVRDEHCRFPGCRMPARRCDLDHSHDAALGGETTASNLAHLCKRHHTLKHASAWSVRQLARGVLEWTSPTSRRHLDTPEPVVRFMPSGGPPPF